MSNETPYGLCKLCEAAARLGVPPPVSIQNDFSLLDRRFEGHLAEACAPHHLNIGCVLFLGGAQGAWEGSAPWRGAQPVHPAAAGRACLCRYCRRQSNSISAVCLQPTCSSLVLRRLLPYGKRGVQAASCVPPA